MDTIIIRIEIENVTVQIEVVRDADYRHLKEVLRDTLCPIVSRKYNWGRIVEIIRDTAIPHFC